MGLTGILAGLGSVASGILARSPQTGKPLEAMRTAATIVDQLYTDDVEKLDRQAVLARIIRDADGLQASINRIEAASRSLLVAGWRPFIGWICGFALGWHFILQPVLIFGLEAAGWGGRTWPIFDLSTLNTILFGMLGLGTLRTAEKATGKA